MGWAVGSVDGSAHDWGVKSLAYPKNQEGKAFKAIRDFMISAHEQYLFERVYYEQTFLPREERDEHGNLKSREGAFADRFVQFGLTAVIMGTCEELGLPHYQVPIHSWRKRFIGTAKALPGLKGHRATKWFKDQAIAACCKRGWLVDDHNAAEALGILDYALCTCDRSYKVRTDSIFRRAEDAMADARAVA